MKTLEEIIFLLPPELKREVKIFAEFLLQTKAQPKQKHLRMTWAHYVTCAINIHPSNSNTRHWNGGGADVSD